MAEVFISYKREERDAARRLAEALEGCGFSVWWDADLLPGEQYRRVTLEILDNCRAAIVMWSALSVHSGWVLDEAQRALNKGKLIPVRSAGFSDYPLGFGQLHAHDLEEWDGDPDAAAFRPVLSSVEKLTGRKCDRRTAEPAPQPPSTPAEAEREIAFWRGVCDSRDREDLEAYLERYGKAALFGDLARRKLAALRGAAGPEAPEPSPPSPRPARATAQPPSESTAPPPGRLANGLLTDAGIAAATLLVTPVIAFPIGGILSGRGPAEGLENGTEAYGAPVFYLMVAILSVVLVVADRIAARITPRPGARALMVLGALVAVLLVMVNIQGGKVSSNDLGELSGVLLWTASPVLALYLRRRRARAATAEAPAAPEASP